MVHAGFTLGIISNRLSLVKLVCKEFKMQAEGVVHNGVIVIEGGVALPDGTRVTISTQIKNARDDSPKTTVDFPLVHSATPGKLQLTNEFLSECLDADEISG